MNKIKAIFLTMFFLSTAVKAMPDDEEINYDSISKEYAKADAELNALYKKQINEFKDQGADFYGQKESRDVFLKKAQQVWIKMRDASCDYETYESKTGTGFSSIYKKCQLDKTNERIVYLKDNG